MGEYGDRACKVCVYFDSEMPGDLHENVGIFIQGRLKTEKWKDRETGQDRYSTKIVADRIQLLGGGKANQNTGQTQHQAPDNTIDDQGDIPF